MGVKSMSDSSVGSENDLRASRNYSHSLAIDLKDASKQLLKPSKKKEAILMYMGYMGLGLANNGICLIIGALAKKLSEGGVGLVYFVSIFPGLIVKLLFPYVAHYFSYTSRIVIATVFMSLALLLVSYGDTLGGQLIGVAGIAIPASLGEATILSMTSKMGGEAGISAWGCGTGLAGMFGYFWVWLFGDILKFSTSEILLISQSIPVLYITSYIMIHWSNGSFPAKSYFVSALCPVASSNNNERGMVSMDSMEKKDSNAETDIDDSEQLVYDVKPTNRGVEHRETVKIIISLWKIAFALFFVFFSEYVMMTGAWSSMGTDINSESSRQQFYQYSNWLYQFGVWVSRTWGILLPVTKQHHLWYMSFSQFFLLLFFLAACYWRFWTGNSIYPLCVVAGLFGGATYVNGFVLVSRMVPDRAKERVIGGMSVFDTFGIVTADIAGLLIQGCMYRHHGIPGAEFQCGA